MRHRRVVAWRAASLFAVAGARGYLLKGAGQVEIVQSIQAVARGEAVFGPAVANRVLACFSGPPPAPAEAFAELTEREREVLELLARGNSTPRCPAPGA